MVDFTAVADASRPVAQPAPQMNAVAAAPTPTPTSAYDSMMAANAHYAEIINAYAAAAQKALANPEHYTEQQLERARQIEADLAVLRGSRGAGNGVTNAADAGASGTIFALASQKLAAFDASIANEAASGNAMQALLLRYQRALFAQTIASALHGVSMQAQTAAQGMQITSDQAIRGDSWYGGT